MEMWWLLNGDQGWEFAHSLIAHSLIFGEQNERFAYIARFL